MVLSNHLDYVDCRMMNVMMLSVVEVENPMVVEDLIDHLLDRRHRRISMMKRSNHARQSLNPLAICLLNKLYNDE